MSSTPYTSAFYLNSRNITNSHDTHLCDWGVMICHAHQKLLKYRTFCLWSTSSTIRKHLQVSIMLRLATLIHLGLLEVQFVAPHNSFLVL